MPTTTNKRQLLSPFTDLRYKFTLSPTGISAGGSAVACCPVPWKTPVIANPQKKTKKTCQNQKHVLRRTMDDAYPSNNRKPVIESKTFDNGKSAIATEDDSSRTQCKKKSCHATDLRSSIFNSHIDGQWGFSCTKMYL